MGLNNYTAGDLLGLLLGQDGWFEHNSADNAALSVTKSGVSGEQHFLTSIEVSIEDATATRTCQVNFGGNLQFEFVLDTKRQIVLPTPLGAGDGNAISVDVPASGTGGIVAYATITGFTENV